MPSRQDTNLAISTWVTPTRFAKKKTLPQAHACRRALCQDKNLTTSTCVNATSFAKTQTLPQAPGTCVNATCSAKTKTLPQAPASAPRVLPRQKPYHKHQAPASMPCVLPRQKPYRKHLRHRHAFCQDKTLTTSTETKPYHKHMHHRHSFRQDKNLTTSTCVTAARFAKTKTLPQAPASMPRVLPRQNFRKHLRSRQALPRQKPYHKTLRQRHAFC